MSGAPLSEADFARIGGVSRETTARLARHLDLLAVWQRRMNLVGTASLNDPWRRHVLDSAQLAAFLPQGGVRVVDLGSGAGFPGLVIAIVARHRGVTVDLIESNEKRCAFLDAAVRATGAPARVHRARIESGAVPPAAAVTARACAPLGKLLHYAAPYVADGGRAIFPKGRRVADELTAARQDWKLTYTSRPSASDSGGTILIIEAFTRADGR